MRKLFSSIIMMAVLHDTFGNSLNSEQSNEQFSMQLKLDAKELVLNISIENLSKEPITIPCGYLPWERYIAMTLIVVKTDAYHTSLEPLLEVQDIPLKPKDLKLLPGTRESGKIDLAGLFPSLVESRTHGELLLFWSYSPPEIPKRLGGWLLIPKQNKQRNK